MLFSTVLALVGSTGLAAALPARLAPRAVTSFGAGTSWDIVLSGGGSKIKVAQAPSVQVIDLDLFDTDSETIADLKKDKKVLCYFSAGSREDWRPDAKDFQSGDYGKGLDGWDGENWVNIKSENVFNIMKKRIKDAADKGCTAVDPDNVDGYNSNQDGFGYKPEDYAEYVKKLAAEAHSHGLAIGLKNAIEIIPQVVDTVQFAVNEQCHAYGECDRYKPFSEKNLAVFNIEYGGNDCGSPSGVVLSTLIKPEDQSLSTYGAGGCPQIGTTDDEPTPTQPIETTSVPSSTGVSSPTSTDAPNQTKQPSPTTTPTQAPEQGNDDEEDGDQNGPEPTSTRAPRPTRTRRPRPTPWWRHSNSKAVPTPTATSA